MAFYYVPLEEYKERYTCQWAMPVTGWLERNWIKANVPYTRIGRSAPPGGIKTGCVLDAVARCRFSMSQIEDIIMRMDAGEITSKDTIYFDDFWHPGIESIAYVGAIQKNKPKMYAFLHAQSVDEFDFTYPMRQWMRPFEKGIGRILDGIFVCCPSLADKVVDAGISERVHVTGHPFNSEEVLERMPKPDTRKPRRTQVVWSSRWDSEKNPLFFLRVAIEVIKIIPHAKFIICTSAPELRSNEPKNLELLRDAIQSYPNNIELKENLTKEEYYKILTESKVQFNCASQDWVAITLLEAAVAGCYPIYPWFRSFPETLRYKNEFMYEHLDVLSAVKKLVPILNDVTYWSTKEIESRSWIYKRFDYSWIRMLEVMGYLNGQMETAYPGIMQDIKQAREILFPTYAELQSGIPV